MVDLHASNTIYHWDFAYWNVDVTDTRKALILRCSVNLRSDSYVTLDVPLLLNVASQRYIWLRQFINLVRPLVSRVCSAGQREPMIHL